VLVLLPPSEGKAEPASGDPLDLDSLVFAEQLSGLRSELLAALDPTLETAPAAPAADVYSGVLYQRLGLSRLSAAARRKVLIASALWGFVRPDDRIPAYRFSAKSRLPGIGPPSSWWRRALADAVPDEEGELVVDMRSAAYASAWKPKRAALLPVRAFTEVDGVRRPVSHMVKAVRGDVARTLLAAKRPPRDPGEVAAVLGAAGFEAELGAGELSVVVS
jgi:cytoplasmic iron level regulating protein YaaA (DUF328/UPF0246 family)